jgi:predicted nucleic acid-binding protein
MARPLVADTGGLLRALAKRPNGKPSWPEFDRALRYASRVVVPALVLAEVGYFLRAERPAMHKLIAEIFDPETSYEFEPADAQDVLRARVIDAKFADLELGLVDASVATVAERRRVYRVLTIDRDDFEPLRVGDRFTIRLEIVP